MLTKRKDETVVMWILKNPWQYYLDFVQYSDFSVHLIKKKQQQLSNKHLKSTLMCYYSSSAVALQDGVAVL